MTSSPAVGATCAGSRATCKLVAAIDCHDRKRGRWGHTCKKACGNCASSNGVAACRRYREVTDYVLDRSHNVDGNNTVPLEQRELEESLSKHYGFDEKNAGRRLFDDGKTWGPMISRRRDEPQMLIPSVRATTARWSRARTPFTARKKESTTAPATGSWWSTSRRGGDQDHMHSATRTILPAAAVPRRKATSGAAITASRTRRCSSASAGGRVSCHPRPRLRAQSHRRRAHEGRAAAACLCEGDTTDNPMVVAVYETCDKGLASREDGARVAAHAAESARGCCSRWRSPPR